MIAMDRIGAYEVIERRREGGTLLCLATAVADRRSVLVRLFPSPGADDERRARLLGELHVLSLAHHRNLVEVLDVIEEPDTIGLVTEVLDGDDLDSIVGKGGPLEWCRALDVAAQVCAGLHYAHTLGLAHGRLHARQVCLAPDGVAKVLDVGLDLIERVAADGAIADTGLLEATERARMADVRAVGELLAYMLTARSSRAGKPLASALAAGAGPRHEGKSHQRARQAVADLVGVLLDVSRDPGASVPDLAALGRALTAARLALEAPAVDPVPAASSGTSEPDATVLMPMPVADAPLRPAPPWGTTPVSPSVPPASPHSARRLPDGAIWAAVGIVALIAIATTWWIRPVERTKRVVPTTWTLRVDSEPQGAAVLVDGQPASGRTPVDVVLPVDRNPRVEIRLEGYTAVDVPLSQTVRSNGRVRLTLQKPPSVSDTRVDVRLRGSYAFEVLQGDRVVSAAAREHQLQARAGETLRVRNSEYFLSRSYTVPAGGLTESVPALGQVSVQAAAYESCAIVIGNQITRRYPGGDLFSMAAGQYLFGLRCGDGRSPRARPVTIRAAAGVNTVTFSREE